MAENLFNNPTMSMMYQDALHSLFNGAVMPWERDLLAQAPLPGNIVDPFASQEVDPLSLMNLTCFSLTGWIADAKKVNYYSERFVQLSKLVMKGVTTMARGLVTLHLRGEELSGAPMQIDDLISVGSYHFRKSYLGVVQFSSKHPEIGERLLVNQLGWATTLMKLFKTREKLEKPVADGRRLAAGSNEEKRSENKELPDGDSDHSVPQTSPFELNDAAVMGAFAPLGSTDDGMSPIPAMSAQGSYGAMQAFRPLGRSERSKTTGNMKSNENEEGRRKDEEGRRKDEEVRRKDEEERRKDEEIRRKDEEGRSENEEGRRKDEEGRSENEEGRRKNEEGRRKNEEVRRKDEEGRSENEDVLTNEKSETLDNMKSNADPVSSCPVEEIPAFARILERVMERSKDAEDKSLTFTIEEMKYLARDPLFAQFDPVMAADIRRILAAGPPG